MHKGQILVVDDEQFVRRGLRRQLESAGFGVLEAADGAMAMGIVASTKVDLVVSDIIMPKTDGIELLLQIKRANYDIPVLAISGGGRTKNPDLLKFADTLGADGVLAKPFTSEQLLTAIFELVEPTGRA